MLHVVTGAPCSGKTTYVAENAKDGDVRIDFDAIAKAMGAGDHMPTGAIKTVAFAARQAAIEEAVSIGAEAWVIHTNPTDAQMAAYEEAGADFIHLDASLDECLERAANDARPDGTEEAIRSYFSDGAKSNAVEFKQKAFDIQLKESGDETPRIVAYASTFHREPDSYGDVIAKGAFLKSLAKLESEGRYLPLLFGHRMDDPMMNIGRVVNAVEDDNGLLVEAEFDMENPNAVKAHRDVLAKTLNKLSFAYDVIDWGIVELEDGTKANELRELEIYEVSLVPVPANHHAEVIDAKAGRRNSKADTDAVSEAISAIESQLEVIRGIYAADEEEQKSSEDGGEKGSDGCQSKAEESQALLDFYKSAIKESL